MTDSVLARSARGSLYSILVSGATIVLGFTRTVLLMRLLGPDPFGILTLALFFATLASPFMSFGIDNALVQSKDPPRSAFATHFALRLALSLIILAIGLLVSPLLRRYYQDPIIAIFLILLLIHLLEASQSTHTVVLRRDLRFGSIALLNLLSSLGMTITAPLLAFLGFGVWSLVVEQAVGPIIRWVGLWLVIRPWKAWLAFDRSQARAQLSFGSQVLASHLLGILLDRFDDFWTGTTLGKTALGYYSRAYELAQYPERVLANPVANVFFSTYSTLQDKRQELSRAFFRSSSFLVRAGFLLAVLLIAIAPELTILLFTPTWLPIVPIFRLMLIYIVLDPFYVNLSYLLMGVGQPQLLTRLRLAQVAFFVFAVMGLAALWGTNGVALAADLMMLLGVVVLVLYSRRFTDYSLRRMLAWPVLAVICSATAGLALELFAPISSFLLRLVVKAVLVAGVYTLILLFGERQVITEYLGVGLDMLRNRFTAAEKPNLPES